jgi:hypothetical protein
MTAPAWRPYDGSSILKRRRNGGHEMEQLIEAALEHAKRLRQGAHAADGRGARVTTAEAER